MMIRDRIALAWRGYWVSEWHSFQRDVLLQIREDHRDFVAQARENRHWDLILKQRITGKQSPTRKEVRRAVREWEEEQR